MKVINLSLSKVFSNGGDIHYILPHFQREYTWDKTNWKVLFDDAIAVYHDTSPNDQNGEHFDEVEHFLGSTVVINDGTRRGTIPAFKLVDGQQRLTSISLLLKALSEYASVSDPAVSKRIDKLLVNADESGDLFFKLLPTSKNGDRIAYCAIMKGTPPPQTDSKIPTALSYFRDVITEHGKNGLDLERFSTIVTNAFQMVYIELDSKESPYRIFESLNAKGKPLTQGDLVRNYVAMKLPTSEQERIFQTHWQNIENLLHENRQVGRLTELTAFLRHYLAIDTGVLCEEQYVYARFRDRAERDFQERNSFEAELVKIARFAVHYDSLLRPEKLNDPVVRTALNRLNVLEVATGYPFLLTVFERYSSEAISRDQLVEILGILEIYMVRRYIAGEPNSYLTRMFPALAGVLKSGDLATSLRKELIERKFPSNSNLFRAIDTRRLYESTVVRRKTSLILETINRYLSAGTGGFTILDGTSTIEHIMPQSLSDEWKADLGLMWEQIQRDYLHTLGNLTLVTSEWNTSLSNGSFQLKRTKLATHALKINSDYFSRELDTWGRKQILDRGKELMGSIIAIWPSLIPNDKEVVDVIEAESAAASEFDFEAVERVAANLAVPLKRISECRYKSTDGKHRLIGLCSKAYRISGDAAGYWFGLKFAQKKFLEFEGKSWLALECENTQHLLLFAFSEFSPWLPQLDVTEGTHWHVRLDREGDNIKIRLSRPMELKDVSDHKI